MSWKKVKLEKLVDINIGRTPSRNRSEYWGIGSPWLSIRDMNQGNILRSTAEEITALGVEESKVKIAKKGTVLFSFKLSIGKVGIADIDMYHNEAIASMPIKDESLLCEEYLYYALQQLNCLSETDRAVMGATLNKKKIADLSIPLPPLETQKQIAAILQKADQLRKDCQQMEQELNNLAQSVFMDMFGEKASGYKDWPIYSIESLAESNKGSMRTGPFGSDLKHAEFVDSGVAVIGIDNAVKNEFSWCQRRFITREKYEKLKRYRVFPKDLIVTIMGTTGRIAVIPDDIPLAISTKHLAVITLNQKLALPEFIHSAFKLHPLIQSQLRKKCKGAIMDGLNLGLIKSLEIKLPPIEVQKEYYDILLGIDGKITVVRQQAKQHENCFSSIMQRAFNGEINIKNKAA